MPKPLWHLKMIETKINFNNALQKLHEIWKKYVRLTTRLNEPEKGVSIPPSKVLLCGEKFQSKRMQVKCA
jgi:hypothetical protein